MTAIQRALIDACRDRSATQSDVAGLYAEALCCENAAPGCIDWPTCNEAILARWPKGLMRVKRIAWAVATKENQ